MIVFSAKAEIPHFPNLTCGGPIWDLRETYSGFGVPFEKEIDYFSKNFKPKQRIPKSPIGPPYVKFEKYGISAFTEKKNQASSYLDQFWGSFEINI